MMVKQRNSWSWWERQTWSLLQEETELCRRYVKASSSPLPNLYWQQRNRDRVLRWRRFFRSPLWTGNILTSNLSLGRRGQKKIGLNIRVIGGICRNPSSLEQRGKFRSYYHSATTEGQRISSFLFKIAVQKPSFFSDVQPLIHAVICVAANVTFSSVVCYQWQALLHAWKCLGMCGVF